MAVKSKAARTTDVNTLLASASNITAAEHRSIQIDEIDSSEDFVVSYTTAQIAALTGMTLRQRVFDTDFNEYKYYDGTRWVFESHPKYEVYSALLTQTSTNAPVATVLENTLGGTVVWSYVSTGRYEATLTGGFTLNKTVVVFGNVLTAGDAVISCPSGDLNADTVRVDNMTGEPLAMANDILSNTSIEIRVYY